jgi:hypothetical protein
MKTLKLLILILIVSFSSCKKENVFDTDGTTYENNSEPRGIIMQLGNQLQNPYSVESMTRAYDHLKDSLGSSFPTMTIELTHYYVKFSPNSQLELEELKSDTTIELFDFPLDYEVLEDGLYYHDPSLPDSAVTYQYAVVSANYTFPNIQNEILAELYIPELLEELNDNAVELLVDISLRLTGNEPESVYKEDGSKATSWTPSGTIQVYDNVDDVNGDGLIPLEGVKVRARRWFIVKVGHTNAQGQFTTGSFKRKVNYSIKWERKHYDIRVGDYFQSYFNGPKSSSAWNLSITTSDITLRLATIHRAAYRYHYKNIGGLKRPNVSGKIKYCYKDMEGSSAGAWYRNTSVLGILPNIKIYRIFGGNDREMNEIFSTTIHETGHASHCELMNAGYIQFSQVTDQICESWAEAIQWYITKIEYDEIVPGYLNYDVPDLDDNFDMDNKQRWTSANDHDYTPLFIDLVDDYNQSLLKGEQPTDKCPNGGTFDGTGCNLGTPPNGETAFIFSNNFYYTPVGECDCPITNSWFDGANCYFRDIAPNELGFIHNNSWYLVPAGNTDYPNDAINQYTMGYLESNIIKHSYGLSSLQTNLKNNKPTGLTDEYIDAYLNFYFNL